jgi:hypothetical protein
MERENSPAYRALPRSSRRALGVIEKAIAIGGGASAKLSRGTLETLGVQRGTATIALRRLVALGLVDVAHGAPRRINIFRLSDRWQNIDSVEAERLLKATQPRRRGPGRRPQRLPERLGAGA